MGVGGDYIYDLFINFILKIRLVFKISFCVNICIFEFIKFEKSYFANLSSIEDFRGYLWRSHGL